MTHMYFKFSAIAIAAACALGACSQLPPPSAPAQPAPPATAARAPARTPGASTAVPPRVAAAATVAPASAPAPGSTAAPLQIDTAHSLIVVTVRRGGMLARLGHDHVVASHAISGTVAPSQNRADFTFRLDQMKIDEAELRQIAGLEKQPSADAIEGTRHNMLTKVLDAERYPLVAVHAERVGPGQPLQVDITLHGVTRRVAIPVELREENGGVGVKGTVNLKQTDFGLTPFSVMAGAMSVQDQMELRFELSAR